MSIEVEPTLIIDYQPLLSFLVISHLPMGEDFAAEPLPLSLTPKSLLGCSLQSALSLHVNLHLNLNLHRTPPISNSPAKAVILSVVERLTRLRGCPSTQALHPGGDPAKAGGGVRGPMGGGRS
jgi:hypothetical protein